MTTSCRSRARRRGSRSPGSPERCTTVRACGRDPRGGPRTRGHRRRTHPSDSRAAAPHLVKHVERYLQEPSSRIVEAVAIAAEGLGFSPLEVALAWVRDSPAVTSSIVGARTGAQLRGILKSEEITLPGVVRQALDEISSGN